MKRASHIPAPRAAACDDLHLRASAQHWHVSTFCVTGNSPEFPVITSENTLREFPLVIATVAKVSRKRGLWLVVRVKKGDTRRYLHFYSFSSAASYVGMIQIRYTGLGDTANSQPDPSGSPVCLFSFLTRFTIYFLCGKVKFAPGFVHDFKTANFAWIHRYFSCIPCSLLTALCSPPIAFSRRTFHKFPLLPFSISCATIQIG